MAPPLKTSRPPVKRLEKIAGLVLQITAFSFWGLAKNRRFDVTIGGVCGSLSLMFLEPMLLGAGLGTRSAGVNVSR